MTLATTEVATFEEIRQLRAEAINIGVKVTDLYLRGIGLPIEESPVYREADQAWTVAQQRLTQAALQSFEEIE